MKLVIMQKGRKLPEGTIRDWKGRKYKKVAGKWLPHTEGEKSIKRTQSIKQVLIDNIIENQKKMGDPVYNEKVDRKDLQRFDRETLIEIAESAAKRTKTKSTSKKEDFVMSAEIKDRVDDQVIAAISGAKQAVAESGEASAWRDRYEVEDVADDAMEALGDEGLLPENDDAEAELAAKVLAYVTEKWDEG